MAANKCLAERSKVWEGVAGRLRGMTTIVRKSYPDGRCCVRRNDRRNRDPLLLPPTLRPRIGLRRKTIARNSPRAVQVVPGLLITSRELRLAQFVREAGWGPP